VSADGILLGPGAEFLPVGHTQIGVEETLDRGEAWGVRLTIIDFTPP
jgi:hypothetical protein